MSKLFITATSTVTDADLPHARLGQRFGRMDLSSQLALLAVESLAGHFESIPRDRIAIILAAQTGSLSTDAEFWRGRDNPGGPSPTLFTYTLPSAAIGEIAIRHRITGPNLCFAGNSRHVLPEAADMIRRAEVEGCICVYVHAVSPVLAGVISSPTVPRSCALFLRRDGRGVELDEENHRDMETLCATLRPKISTK